MSSCRTLHQWLFFLYLSTKWFTYLFILFIYVKKKYFITYLFIYLFCLIFFCPPGQLLLFSCVTPSACSWQTKTRSRFAFISKYQKCQQQQQQQQRQRHRHRQRQSLPYPCAFSPSPDDAHLDGLLCCCLYTSAFSLSLSPSPLPLSLSWALVAGCLLAAQGFAGWHITSAKRGDNINTAMTNLLEHALEVPYRCMLWRDIYGRQKHLHTRYPTLPYPNVNWNKNTLLLLLETHNSDVAKGNGSYTRNAHAFLER